MTQSHQLASSQWICFDQTPLTLSSGQSLGPITIDYMTYGTLNASRSNAILVCHALTADAHAGGENGWWSHMIGSGKPIDTDRFFVICSNMLGSCKGTTGPASIDPKTQQPYGKTFPIITISDMVAVQKALIDHLNISTLLAVVGGSMGGMQALQWSLQYPDYIDACACIATAAQLSAFSLAFNTVGRHAIEQHSTEGLGLARQMGHVTYLSDHGLHQKFGRQLQNKSAYGFDWSMDFQIESYLAYQGQKFAKQFDPLSYLYLSKALSYFDLTYTYGSLQKALSPAKASFLFVAIQSDWLYSQQQSLDIVKVLLKQRKAVSYATLDSPYGHDTFLLPDPLLLDLLSTWLCQQ